MNQKELNKFVLAFPSLISLLFLSAFVVSCKSSQKITEEKRLPNQVQTENAKPDQLNIDLITLIEKSVTGRELALLPKAEALNEEELLNLKTYFRNLRPEKESSPKGPTLKGKQIAQFLRKNDFASIQDASIDKIIDGLDRLPNKTAEEILNSVATASECIPAKVTMAMASYSERGWPEPQAKVLSNQLYEKVYQCGSGEMKARAAYRLAMFSVAEANCEKSLQYWPSVKESKEAQFLFSRTEYWKNYCEQLLNKSQISLIEFYRSFPLSFHPILHSYNTQQDLSAIIAQKKSPIALLRSQKNEQVNLLISQVELAIENDQDEQAKQMLNWVSEETWKEMEPSFLIYVGHLASLTKSGLVMFKSISRAISEDPNLLSSTTLKLFYPKWFYENIEAEAKKNGLDPLLVMSLVRQESAFETRAQSRVGARGLMQLMPRTARSLIPSLRKKDLYDPNKNLEVGTKFLARLLKKYDGNVILALAAYNAGPKAVDTWVSRYQVTNPILFKDLIPYRETREYVASILRNWYWYQVIENQKPSPQYKISAK
jgi:hypothetical protein